MLCFLHSEQKTSRITGELRGKDEDYFKERNMLFSNSTVVVTYRRTSQSEFQKDEDEERDNYLKYGLKEKFLKEKKKT